VDGVTKRYGRSGAGVFDLSFEIERGEIFGFLGPNGAGKTTTIRLLLDLLRPDTGAITALGCDSRRDSVALHRRLGYLPGELALYDRLTPRQTLGHFGHLRGLTDPRPAEQLAERFGLALDREVRTLSRGNKQKVGLLQALMGDPELLVLDEPTGGLDPLVQKQVHDELRDRAESGATIFLSSHALAEVAAVADRVGIIRDGRIVAVENVADLRRRAVRRIEARFTEPLSPDHFEGVPGVRRVEIDGATARLEIDGPMDAVVKAIARSELVELVAREPSLEDVFLAYYAPEET
jgi:ABC-2 type transport system ATP-binding protein